MKRLLLGFAALVVASIFVVPAMASVSIVIDKSDQRMYVNANGQKYTWAVSTGRKSSWTPSGSFGVQSMKRMHYSSIYENAPMPHSIFFNGNVAIHGTTAVGQLGNPASHGCVRLAPGNAATLYSLVQKNGRRASIVVRQ